MKNNIYTFWMQGFNNAPDIVKICHNSLQKYYNSDKNSLIVLDQKNLFHYVDLPGYIMDKYRKKKITITHLSDIIRFMLLRDNGGLWTDATMLFTKPLEQYILFESDFFSLKNKKAMEKDISSKWECFFIAGKKDFPLFSMLVDFWLEYWKKEEELITYFLTEHIFYIAYNENRKVKKALDGCPKFYYPTDYFQKLLNKPYSTNTYNEIIFHEPYLKMTYKRPFFKVDKQGRKTYYGHLLEEYR